MNPIDDQLNRLFRAAGQVQPGPIPAPPFGLETRVLAAWREARATPMGFFWDTTALVRGLILASLIMAVSFWPALDTSTVTTTTASNANPFNDFLSLADSTVSSDDSP
jgi:hypothetical protein